MLDSPTLVDQNMVIQIKGIIFPGYISTFSFDPATQSDTFKLVIFGKLLLL